jgi:hypothetical protein
VNYDPLDGAPLNTRSKFIPYLTLGVTQGTQTSLRRLISVTKGVSRASSTTAPKLLNLSRAALNLLTVAKLGNPALTPAFTRGSSAYAPDGSLVTGNSPRLVNGRTGSALLIEEGTTNLLGTAGNFDVDTNADGVADGWQVLNDPSAAPLNTWVANLQAGVWAGSQAQYYKPTSAQGWGQLLATTGTYSLTAGNTYTISFWAKSLTGGQWGLGITNGPSTVAYAATYNINPSAGGAWQRYTYTFTSLATGSDAQIRFVANAASPNSVNVDILVDNLQLELKDHVTSYVAGTRNNELLTISRTTDLKKGTVEFIFSPTEDPTSTGHLFNIGTYSTPTVTEDYLQVNFGTSWGKNRISVALGLLATQARPEAAVTLPSNLVPGQWYYVAGSWDASGAGLTITVYDYTAGQVYTSTVALAAGPSFDLATQISIGGTAAGESPNSLLDQFRLSSAARTNTDIQNAYMGLGALIDQSTVAAMDFGSSQAGYGVSYYGVTTYGASSAGPNLAVYSYDSAYVRKQVVKGLIGNAPVLSAVIKRVNKSFTAGTRLLAKVINAMLGNEGGFHRFQIVHSDGTITYLSNSQFTFNVRTQRLATDTRSANGVLKRRQIAVKRIFSLSWEMLPYLTSKVIDGGAGAQELEALVNKAGVVTLFIPSDAALYPGDAAQCFITLDGIDYDQQFINGDMYWTPTLTLEEI